MRSVRWMMAAVAALMLVAATASAQSILAPPQTPKPVNRPVLFRIAAEGDPLQIGIAQGNQCAGRLQELLPRMIEVAEAIQGIKKYTLYGQAAKLSIPLSETQIREMRGIAQGSGLAYEDVLFLNMFYCLLETKMGCRQLAAWGDAAAGGALIHGRNLDWYDYQGDLLKKNNLIANLKPENSLEIVTIGWPGLVGVLTGTNRAGLTVGFNRLQDGHKQYRLAEPIFFTLRRILERCSTLDAAVQEMKAAKPLGNGTIMISSAREKSALVIELVDGEIGVRRPEGLWICNANHATREAGLPNARRRRPADAPMGPVIQRLGLPLNARKMRTVLSAPEVLQDMNILSVIFEPDQNRMHLSCGIERAAAGSFQTLVLFPPSVPTAKPIPAVPALPTEK